MTEQPQPKADWVAIIKGNIETDDEYRQVTAHRKSLNAGVKYFDAFFQSLQEKAERDEYVDPKAFEKAVRAYPDLISAPLIASIITNATFDKYALRELAKRQLESAHRRIDRTHAKSMEIMETQIYGRFQKILDQQEERLAQLREIEEEQDVHFMRALTLWQEYEDRKYVHTWSPIKQFQNIRNIFRRHALEKQAMQAYGECQPTKGRELANEIKVEHEKSTQELTELKEAFRRAKERIEHLSVGELDVFNGKLQREVHNRTSRLLIARFEILYPPPPNTPK